MATLLINIIAIFAIGPLILLIIALCSRKKSYYDISDKSQSLERYPELNHHKIGNSRIADVTLSKNIKPIVNTDHYFSNYPHRRKVHETVLTKNRIKINHALKEHQKEEFQTEDAQTNTHDSFPIFSDHEQVKLVEPALSVKSGQSNLNLETHPKSPFILKYLIKKSLYKNKNNKSEQNKFFTAIKKSPNYDNFNNTTKGVEYVLKNAFNQISKSEPYSTNISFSDGTLFSSQNRFPKQFRTEGDIFSKFNQTNDLNDSLNYAMLTKPLPQHYTTIEADNLSKIQKKLLKKENSFHQKQGKQFTGIKIDVLNQNE